MTVRDETRHHASVYWHRALPPLEAEPIGDHVLEATSTRVPGTLAHRDELWDRCYQQLVANTTARLAQEIVRLGGDCARIHDEWIATRHDAVTGEAWLQGRFSYMLYRQPVRSSP